MDAQFIQSQIVAVKALIVKYQAAILALSDVSTKTYILDTGQTRTQVTKQDSASLNNTISLLWAQLTGLEALLHGSAVQVRPGW